MFLAHAAAQNPATMMQMMHAMYSAGAHGAARSAWVEINRPLTTLGINASLAVQTAAPFGNAHGVTAGVTLQLPTFSLPIGMDIKSITCTSQDVNDGWCCPNFTFGTLNLINPQGTFANLSPFDPILEHEDRLAPWILSKTKVDVQVTAQVTNYVWKWNVSVSPPLGDNSQSFFHGFNLNAFQEEQVCAIQTRIEPTDRNVGNAELINHFRQVMGSGLGLTIPAFTQAPSQIGRVPIMHAPMLSPAVFAQAPVPYIPTR